MTLQRYEHTGAAPGTTLAASITAVSSTFTVTNGSGYPTGAIGPFVVKLDAGTAAEEKILCEARATNSFTVLERGYDGTSATSHSEGSCTVEHDYSAAEADDTSDHLYTTTRDDHTQYARTDGTRTITGDQTFATGVTVTTGGVTVTAGGLSVAAGTTAVQALTTTTISGSTITGTGEVKGTDFNATGLTGAVAGARFVGATTQGAPGSGTFVAGDFIVDQTGTMFVCTVGGTPGTWVQVGGGGGYTKKTIAAVNATTSSGTPSEIDSSLEITATVGSSGIADVLISAVVYCTGTNTTDCSLYTQVDSAGYVICGGCGFIVINDAVDIIGRYRYTGLTPGSHTFYAGWNAGGGGTLNLAASSRGATRNGSYHVVTTP